MQFCVCCSSFFPAVRWSQRSEFSDWFSGDADPFFRCWCSVFQWAGLPPFGESRVSIYRAEAARFETLAHLHPVHRSSAW